MSSSSSSGKRRKAKSGSNGRNNGRMKIRFLHGWNLWLEIQKLAGKSQKVVAAVAYVGKKAHNLLPWTKGSVVIADLSEGTVKSGSSSAKGALKLLKKDVEVWSLRGLHSKVFVFDRHTAVVGSMNLSESSSSSLEEAGVVIEGPEVETIRRYVEFLREQAKKLSKARLEELKELEELAEKERKNREKEEREKSEQMRVRLNRKMEGRTQEVKHIRTPGEGESQDNTEQSATKAFLLTWNPFVTKMDWQKYVQKCREKGWVEDDWSFGNRKDPTKVPKGSLVFLIRLGNRVKKEDKGILAIGKTIGELREGEYWPSVADVKFIVCSERPLATLEELESRWPNVWWSPPASGWEIPPEVGQELYKLCLQRWKEQESAR